MQTLSRLTMFLRDVRTTVAKSSGTPSYGTRHSQVASKKDIAMIIDHVTENKLLSYQPGRVRISNMHNARCAQEGQDAWAIGLAQHWTGVPLAAVVRKRVDYQLTSKVYQPSTPLQHDGIEREDAFDAGSVCGSTHPSDQDEPFDLGDTSDSESDGASDTSNQMGEDGFIM